MITPVIKTFKQSSLLKKIPLLTNNHIQSFSFSASSPIIFHRLQIDTLSDKWHIDFSYTSTTLSQNDQSKIRPYNFGRVFSIKFVQKSMRFVKGIESFYQKTGRPEYKIQLLANQVIRLAYWQPQYEKYQVIRSTPYRQEVFFVQKVLKKNGDQGVQQLIGSTKQSLNHDAVTLFRFNFYVLIFFIKQKNNKLDGQKSKDFFLAPGDMNMLQWTLRSSFGGLTFNENKQEYEIWKLQRQIVKKELAIFKEEEEE